MVIGGFSSYVVELRMKCMKRVSGSLNPALGAKCNKSLWASRDRAAALNRGPVPGVATRCHPIRCASERMSAMVNARVVAAVLAVCWNAHTRGPRSGMRTPCGSSGPHGCERSDSTARRPLQQLQCSIPYMCFIIPPYCACFGRSDASSAQVLRAAVLTCARRN